MRDASDDGESRGQPFGNSENEVQPVSRKENEQALFANREKAGSAYSNSGIEPVRPPAPHRIGFSGLLLAALIGALLCLGLGGLVGWQIGKNISSSQTTGPGGNSTYKNGNMTREQVIAQTRPSVVQINVQRGQGEALGSGEIIDQQGHIVTNYHVVADGQKFQVVLFDGSALPASLTGVDPTDDLAVIQVNSSKPLSPIAIGDSSRLVVGNDVLAIGNPLGITQTVTSGIVSALGRTIPEGSGGGSIINAVQTDAPINPGNSGGALVNMKGELVGIPTLVPLDPEFKTPASGVGFAIPSNRVKFIAPQLIQHGKVTHSGRPALGATVVSVDPRVAAQAGLSVEHGVLIVNVRAKGAAEQAGLRSGDVITQVNSTPVNNTSDLSDALLHNDPGSTVTLNIVRGTQQMQVKVKLEELKIS